MLINIVDLVRNILVGLNDLSNMAVGQEDAVNRREAALQQIKVVVYNMVTLPLDSIKIAKTFLSLILIAWFIALSA